ncbi:hypothetical protein AKJ09_08854 [Labilithrix luteola]|uniref:Uncharacterized protein n=1 Tax=Labilithrix luteola TaxID=1391654 RepID=A0A0K1Q8R5_9BACT|nr:hypothetical protein [Labilithrix luteola]AKV02191.1 hypothetical protein AKJ09_08854 [Labilithrix luteola]
MRVSFDGPALPEGATLDLGDGVTVSGCATNGVSLSCDFAVTDRAKTGARDLTVSADGVDPVIGAGAFVVAAPIDAKVGAGKPEQGGLASLTIANRDRTWFDTENFYLVSAKYQKGGATLVQLKSDGLTATDGAIILLGDPLAETGPLGFIGINNPDDPDTATFATAADAVTVAQRAPAALVSGTPSDKSFEQPYETAFFQADLAPQAAEGLLVDAYAKKPAGSTMAPLVLAYPASGKVADLLDQKTDDPGFPAFGIPATEARVAYPVVEATKGYFIVFDKSLASGPTTQLSFDYRTYRATIVAEQAGAHDSTAQDLGVLAAADDAVPGRIVQGSLGKASEMDTYAFHGLSGEDTIDLQVSLYTDSNLTVLVDSKGTFDSPSMVSISLSGKTGSSTTVAMYGTSRFIRVMAADSAAKPTGSYKLGVRRLP